MEINGHIIDTVEIALPAFAVIVGTISAAMSFSATTTKRARVSVATTWSCLILCALVVLLESRTLHLG